MMSPESLSPDEHWALITSRPRPNKIVPFPGTIKDDRGRDITPEIRIILLNQGESTMCNVAAEATTRRKFGKDIPAKDQPSEGYLTTYRDELLNEVVYACCKRVDDPQMMRPFFNRKIDVEDLFPDEPGILFNEYCLLQVAASPINAATATEEELNIYIQRISKEGARFPFGSLSSGLATQLMTHMARRLLPCAIVSSSPGTPPDENS